METSERSSRVGRVERGRKDRAERVVRVPLEFRQKLPEIGNLLAPIRRKSLNFCVFPLFAPRNKVI